MTLIMPKSKTLDWRYGAGVVDLVHLAELNFLLCKKIYEAIENKQDSLGYSFLLLSANNSFYESIGIIHTLLCSTKEEEFRMEPYLKSEIEKKKAPTLPISNEKLEEFFKCVDRDYPHTSYLDYEFLTVDDDRLVGDIVADIKAKKTIESGMTDFKKLKDKFENYGFHKIRHQTAAHKNKHLDLPAGAASHELNKKYVNNLGGVVKDLTIDTYTWFNYELANPLQGTLDSLDKLISVSLVKNHENRGSIRKTQQIIGETSA